MSEQSPKEIFEQFAKYASESIKMFRVTRMFTIEYLAANIRQSPKWEDFLELSAEGLIAIEEGHVQITFSQAEIICKALGITIARLINTMIRKKENDGKTEREYMEQLYDGIRFCSKELEYEEWKKEQGE